MAIKGPDIHFDYGWACPVQVDGDSTIDFTGETVTLRWGTPGPDAEGEIEDELGSLELSVSAPRTAFGIVPRASTRISPSEVYAYNVSVGDDENAYLVTHGLLRVRTSVGGGI